MSNEDDPTNVPAGSLDLQFPSFPQWEIVEGAGFERPEVAALCSIWAVSGTQRELAGTGWLVAPAVVLTAAHVVCDARERGATALALTFVRGPERSVSVDACQLAGTVEEKDILDAAALPLTEALDLTPLAIQPGPATLGTAVIAGFPRHSSVAPGTLVRHRGAFQRPPERPELVLHQVETRKGHSGAPMVDVSTGTPRAISIHVGGFDRNPLSGEAKYAKHNLALVFEGPLLAWLLAQLEA